MEGGTLRGTHSTSLPQAYWPSQPWFPHVSSLLITQLVLLPQFFSFLAQMSNWQDATPATAQAKIGCLSVISAQLSTNSLSEEASPLLRLDEQNPRGKLQDNFQAKAALLSVIRACCQHSICRKPYRYPARAPHHDHRPGAQV